MRNFIACKNEKYFSRYLILQKKIESSITLKEFFHSRDVSYPSLSANKPLQSSRCIRVERIISEKGSAKVLSSRTVKREGREARRDEGTMRARLWHRRSHAGHPPNFLPHIMNGQKRGPKLGSLCHGMFSSRAGYDIWVAQKPPMLIDRPRLTKPPSDTLFFSHVPALCAGRYLLLGAATGIASTKANRRAETSSHYEQILLLFSLCLLPADISPLSTDHNTRNEVAGISNYEETFNRPK